MSLTRSSRGEAYCPECGSKLRWARLLSGRWIALEPQPILYIPHQGRNWLVDRWRLDTEILKDCKIWKKGMPRENLKKGFLPHAFTECGTGRRRDNEQDPRD